MIAFYNTVAWNIFYRGPENCTNHISAALSEVQELVKVGDGRRLQELFNLCEPVKIEDEQEVTFFYRNLFDQIANYMNDRQ